MVFLRVFHKQEVHRGKDPHSYHMEDFKGLQGLGNSNLPLVLCLLIISQIYPPWQVQSQIIGRVLLSLS